MIDYNSLKVVCEPVFFFIVNMNNLPFSVLTYFSFFLCSATYTTFLT